MYNWPRASLFDEEENENGKKYTQIAEQIHPTITVSQPTGSHTHSATQPQRRPNSHAAHLAQPRTQAHALRGSADRQMRLPAQSRQSLSPTPTPTPTPTRPGARALLTLRPRAAREGPAQPARSPPGLAYAAPALRQSPQVICRLLQTSH